MEKSDVSLPEVSGAEKLPADDETIIYPPKFEKEDKAATIWMRSIVSLAAYLILGYYIFPSYKMLLLITAIVMIHELGHFFAMKFYRYNELGIFFIPLLGAYVSGTKREVSQKQSAVILLAGPLPGIIIGTIFYLVDQNFPYKYLFDISYSTIGMLFIFLNLINLLPVYPLDGGQLLNRIFLDEESIISKIFIGLSIGALAFFAWRMYANTGSSFSFILLLFPIMMLLRLFGENKLSSIEKRIELEGINTDLEYDELPAADYWKIRNIIIEEHPQFNDVSPSPPFKYDAKEERIMTTVQSLLHRHLIQDVSVAGKIFIFLIWMAAIASPWLLNMEMGMFSRFGF